MRACRREDGGGGGECALWCGISGCFRGALPPTEARCLSSLETSHYSLETREGENREEIDGHGHSPHPTGGEETDRAFPFCDPKPFVLKNVFKWEKGEEDQKDLSERENWMARSCLGFCWMECVCLSIRDFPM